MIIYLEVHSRGIGARQGEEGRYRGEQEALLRGQALASPSARVFLDLDFTRIPEAALP